MAITIPLELIDWPVFRILVRQRWGDGGTSQEQSGGSWEALPMEGNTPNGLGYRFQYCDRAALPMVGTARFAARFGVIDNQVIGLSSATLASVKAGEPWDSDTSTLNVRDLTGYEVRIQLAHRDEAIPDWRTVWWGSVDSQTDTGWPGADIPAGERVYNCIDGLARTKTWMLDRHGYIAQNFDSAAATQYVNVRGPLGYNVGRGASSQDSRLSSNKNGTAATWNTDAGIAVAFHTTPGSTNATYWTDHEAVNHALALGKPPREPLFITSGFTNLLSQNVSAFEVAEGDTVWDFLNKVCRRERGRGLAYCDWDDDSSNPDGPLTCKVTIRPQLSNDLTYAHPVTGATVTLAGADSSGTTVTVDLIGDHRVQAGGFSLGDPYQHKFDHLESRGEKIEVLASPSFSDNQSGTGQSTEGVALVRGWSPSEQTTFRAFTGATLLRRCEGRFRSVYQYYKVIRPDWKGYMGNGAGTGGTLTRADYRCEDNGSITIPSFWDLPTMSGEDVELMHDLPMYEGYDYSGTTPTRYDAGSEYQDPCRRKIMVFQKKTGDLFVFLEQNTSISASHYVDKNGMWLIHSDDDGSTTRKISDTTLVGSNTLSAAINYSALAMTVGIRLPNRVRFASGNPDGRKKGLITHRDHHLWLAHPGAIYDLDCSSGSVSAGFAPKRKAGFTTPGILRDDRAALAQLHQLAYAWYGPVFQRRNATWSIRDCGLFDTFSAIEGSNPAPGATPTDMAYPKLGDLVDSLFANGQGNTINTPVTRVVYDNEAGVTTYSTEWAELDWAK